MANTYKLKRSYTTILPFEVKIYTKFNEEGKQLIPYEKIEKVAGWIDDMLDDVVSDADKNDEWDAANRFLGHLTDKSEDVILDYSLQMYQAELEEILRMLNRAEIFIKYGRNA